MNIHINYNALLDDWREEAIKKLDQGFEKQLVSSDSVLLDFADKAESVNIQNRFFEAQREIWLKSENLKTVFHEQLLKSMDDFPDYGEELCKELEPEEEDDLALLEIDEYDKKIALQRGELSRRA